MSLSEVRSFISTGELVGAGRRESSVVAPSPLSPTLPAESEFYRDKIRMTVGIEHMFISSFTEKFSVPFRPEFNTGADIITGFVY